MAVLLNLRILYENYYRYQPQCPRVTRVTLLNLSVDYLKLICHLY